MKTPIPTSTLFIVLSFIVSSSAFAKNNPLPVGVSPLSELLISSKNSAPANIISLNQPIISAEITGRALTIKAETGDFVKKDHTLVKLDCRSYILAKKQAEAGLNVAKAQLNYADKQFKRNQQLLKKGIIPPESFEKAEASKLTALATIELKKASIETARLAISRCQIKAPFSAQITKRQVQQGQLVTPGTPLFTLIQNEKLEIKTDLSPSEIVKLKDASFLEFVSGKQRFKLKVRSIIQQLDEVTRTQEVRLAPPKDIKLAAGLSGRIVWSSKKQLLPPEYLMMRNDQLGVMIASDIVEGIGKATFYPLSKAREGQPAEIDLPANTAIITQNRYRVNIDQEIKVQQ